MKCLFWFVLPTVLRRCPGVIEHSDGPFGCCDSPLPAPTLGGWFLARSVALLAAGSLCAAAPPTALHITNTGMNSEGLQTFRLEWNALSNATYLIQSADSLAPGSSWRMLDTVQFR